jgi:hypothetical protein
MDSTSNLLLLIPSPLSLQNNFFALIVKLQPQHLMVMQYYTQLLTSHHILQLPAA